MKYGNVGLFTHKNKSPFRGKSKVFIAILVVCLLLSTTVTYAAMTINRTSSTYNDTSPYRSYMQYKMNCYGYVTHLYYPGSSQSSPYKQQPGEFAQNSEPWWSLSQSYWWAMTYWNNMYNFVHDRAHEDYWTLNQYDNFNITETTLTASVPCNKRKIAMVIRQDGANSDYHFLFRHSDGTWSNKPGTLPITNLSEVTQTPITDSNIATVGTEGIGGAYDDGTRYYLIDKAAVVDFPHNLGQQPNDQYTTVDFRDMAGDTLSKSRTIYGAGGHLARFDYPGDIDYYEFIPILTGWHLIYTDLGTGYNVNGAVLDSNGNTLASDSSSANAYLIIYLYANQTYYIYMTDANQNVVYYTLYHVWVSP